MVIVAVVVALSVAGRHVVYSDAAHDRLLPAMCRPRLTGPVMSRNGCDYNKGWGRRLALGHRVLGLYHGVLALARVAPGMARIGNDGGDFNVVQLAGKGRHRRTGTAVQHRLQLRVLGT